MEINNNIHLNRSIDITINVDYEVSESDKRDYMEYKTFSEIVRKGEEHKYDMWVSATHLDPYRRDFSSKFIGQPSSYEW